MGYCVSDFSLAVTHISSLDDVVEPPTFLSFRPRGRRRGYRTRRIVTQSIVPGPFFVDRELPPTHGSRRTTHPLLITLFLYIVHIPNFVK